ncbi:hypothetical protein vseg_019614 [Gypsophila vaccaria]
MTKTAELVFVPTPGMGHILSTVQFAKLILHSNNSISISILLLNIPSHNSSKLTAYVDSQSRDNPYPTRLTFLTLPPLSNPPDPSPSRHFSSVIHLHKPLVKEAVAGRVRAGFPKPVGFVVDFFCTDMVDVANEMNVPTYVYFTSGANFLNFVFYTRSFADDHIATEFSREEFSAVVPGFKNPVTSKVIPAVFHEKNTCELFLNIARRFRDVKGILVNTYAQLEPFAVEALMNGGNVYVPTVYPVGPILDLGGGGADNKHESVFRWLDGQPKSSVVFLCFGSWGSFEEEQVKEIANGLERSGQRFLWVLRKPPPKGNVGFPSDDKAYFEALPKGFLDRTSGQGKIIAWAPQVEVLAHPAVGGFVSHCGWNSTLESLWFGVPMATWPMYAEQRLNAFTLVKELELAVEIRMDYMRDVITGKSNYLVTAEEIENGVRSLMNMDEKTRERVKKMSEEGKKAMKKGGSSYNYLERFIEDVSSNVV